MGFLHKLDLIFICEKARDAIVCRHLSQANAWISPGYKIDALVEILSLNGGCQV